MVRVQSKINNSGLKALKREVFQQAKELASELRNETYDTLYSICSAIAPFENQYGVAVKTGALRRSITPGGIERVNENLVQTEVFFDTSIAPHAVFVIEGTEKMEARPIHLIALELIRMRLK